MTADKSTVFLADRNGDLKGNGYKDVKKDDCKDD